MLRKSEARIGNIVTFSNQMIRVISQEVAMLKSISEFAMKVINNDLR